MIYLDRFPIRCRRTMSTGASGLRRSTARTIATRPPTASRAISCRRHNNVNGYDFPMLYGELFFPQVAEGLMLRAGRFIAIHPRQRLQFQCAVLRPVQSFASDLHGAVIYRTVLPELQVLARWTTSRSAPSSTTTMEGQRTGTKTRYLETGTRLAALVSRRRSKSGRRSPTTARSMRRCVQRQLQCSAGVRGRRDHCTEQELRMDRRHGSDLALLALAACLMLVHLAWVPKRQRIGIAFPSRTRG